MISRFESSDNDKTFSSFVLMELQAFARSCFYDVEFFTFVTFSDDCFTLEIIDGLETVDQLQLLEFIKAIKKFDLIKESSFLSSSVNAGFDHQSLKNLTVKHISFTDFLCLYGGRSLVVIEESELTEASSLFHGLCQFYLLIEIWVVGRSSIVVEDDFDTTFWKNVVSGTFVTIFDDVLACSVSLWHHGASELQDFFFR